ncbi:MAG: HD family phosphohydrolase [Pseudomonadota bacterium]
MAQLRRFLRVGLFFEITDKKPGGSALIVLNWNSQFKKMTALLSELLQSFARAYEGNTTELVKEGKPSQRQLIARLSYCAAFAFLIAFVVGRSHQSPLPTPLPRLGDFAEKNLVSPLTVEIEPREASPQEREALAKKVPPIFDYDDKVTPTWVNNWKTAFRIIRNDFYKSPQRKPVPTPNELVMAKLLELTGDPLSARSLIFLHQNGFSKECEETFVKTTAYLKDRFVTELDLFPLHYNTGILVRQINQKQHEVPIQDVSKVWSLEQAREVVLHAPQLIKDAPKKVAVPISLLVSDLIKPNLRANPVLSQQRVEAFLASTRPLLVALKEGQVIVAQGERITEQNLEVLRALQELSASGARLKRFCLTFIIFFVFLNLLFNMGFSPKTFWSLPLKDSLLFMLSVTGSLAVLKLFYLIGQNRFSSLIDGYGLEYLIPVASGGIILTLLMGKTAAYTYAFGISIIIGYMLDQHFFFCLWCLVVNITSIESIKSYKQRSDLLKTGIFAGAAGTAVVLAFTLINIMGFRNPIWSEILICVSLSFLSGLLSSGLSGLFIPLLESAFGYTTSLKLLELSNFNHPLLHNLMMKAPGTYHHSVIVGSLAELAADRIGANALLARVSAYYHDIGKMTKPLYFIENQSPNNNPHDHLAPHMSAKILVAHVKNGVRLGKEHHLGDSINNIIEQHHGTTLANYFYNKAKYLSSQSEEAQPPHEADFRYPGPKPQSREAGIVMMADACEAATRSIADPTPSKIQAMVQSIIQKRFLEEQFTECDLTQKELKIIEETFTRTLTSLYHHRIEYPGQKNIVETGVNPLQPPKRAS